MRVCLLFVLWLLLGGVVWAEELFPGDFLEQFMAALQAGDAEKAALLVQANPQTVSTLENVFLAKAALSSGEEAKQLKALSQLFQQLSGVLEADNDSIPELEQLQAQGEQAYYRSDYQAALTHWQKGLQQAEALNNQAYISQFLGNLGVVYRNLGEYQRVLEYYEKALVIDREIGDRRGVGNNLTNIGNVYSNLGEYQRALEYYEKALEIKREIGDRRGEGADLTNIGVVYRNLGEYQRALEYYEKALEIKREIGDRQGEGKDLNNLGVVYKNLKQYEQAIDHYQQALVVFTETGEPENLWLIWKNLSRLTAQQNNPTAAIFYGKQAVNTIQTLRRHVSQLEDKNLHSSFLKNKTSVYQNLADLLIQQGRLFEAQQVLAMLKEEEYFDFIRRTRDFGDLDEKAAYTANEQPWHTRYQEIRHQIITIEQDFYQLRHKIILSDSEQAKLDTLRSDLEVARQALLHTLKQLEIELKNQGTTADQIALGEKLFNQLETLKETLRELGEGTVLIHYLITDTQLHIILTTADTVLSRSIELTQSDLNSAVFGFREQLRHVSGTARGWGSLTNESDDSSNTENPEQLTQQAQQLYQWLIKPIQADLQQANAKTLMIYLDKALRYLPFAALHDGEDWLVQNYALVTYTAAAAQQLKSKPRTEWQVAALGTSEARLDFNPLPAVTNELNNIVLENAEDKAGVLQGNIYLNDDFNRNALQRALERDTPVVHIASHFVFKPGTDQDSFLLLGDGDKMTLANFNQASLPFGNIDLFTLSACNTAMGDVGNGTEVEGLATLVQNRGAKSVLATLWAVNDNSTGDFMQHLYQQRVQGALNKALALQRTQQAFINAGQADSPYPEKYAHPFYWAPFILMGNWL